MNLQLCFWQFECKGGEDNGMAKMVRSEEGRGGNKVFLLLPLQHFHLNSHKFYWTSTIHFTHRNSFIWRKTRIEKLLDDEQWIKVAALYILLLFETFQS